MEIRLFIFVFSIVVCSNDGNFQSEDIPQKQDDLTDLNQELFNGDRNFIPEEIVLQGDSNDENEIQISSDNEIKNVEREEYLFEVSEKVENVELNSNEEPATVSNATSSNSTSETKNTTDTKIECILKELPENEIASVKLMNSSALLKELTPTSNSSTGECAVVLFYSSQCIFSARTAPHFNALARVFPGISFFAIDTIVYSNLHMRYGLVAVPTVMLFHNGRAIAKFNDTHPNLERFVNFVIKYTGLTHNGTLNVTSADMSGPVPATLTKKVDIVLILAWCFTIFCICLWFVKSSVCNRMVESIMNTWREAEAQHEHED